MLNENEWSSSKINTVAAAKWKYGLKSFLFKAKSKHNFWGNDKAKNTIKSLKSVSFPRHIEQEYQISHNDGRDGMVPPSCSELRLFAKSRSVVVSWSRQAVVHVYIDLMTLISIALTASFLVYRYYSSVLYCSLSSLSFFFFTVY